MVALRVKGVVTGVDVVEFAEKARNCGVLDFYQKSPAFERGII